jgi:spore coat polysaccharide biosynthesis protein SpsF (cytidylyltransferase family)
MSDAMVTAIVQARLGSTRLPGKVLIRLAGRPVLAHVLERVRAAKRINDVIVATGFTRDNLEIVQWCAANDVRVYCGSEDDVLDRFHEAARLAGAVHVVRITADCPLIDPAVIDLVIDRHIETGADYTANVLKETYPDGQDVEAVRIDALNRAWREARLPSEREHVTPFIRNHPELFKLVSVESEVDLGAHRWTLDTEEDLRFIEKVIERLYPGDPSFGIEAVLRLLAAEPELAGINAHIQRNAGYLTSLARDAAVDS